MKDALNDRKEVLVMRIFNRKIKIKNKHLQITNLQTRSSCMIPLKNLRTKKSWRLVIKTMKS